VLLSDIQPLLPDPVLGFRLNPDVPEHDKAGFRNASVAEYPYLVALGDSQTYGVNVAREEAWPQQLATLSGKPIYNMGVPNYGPVQELVLMSHAMTLRPQWVVVAFYSGNDLYDAFSMVYTRKQIVDLRSSDQSVISTIEKAEQESPLDQTSERLFRALSGNFDPVGTLTQTRVFLSKHSRLWGMLRAARRVVLKKTVHNVPPDVLWGEQVSLARRSGGLWIPFAKVRVRTIFVPQVRLTALRMEDPRIHEGLRVSVEAIRRMSSIAQNAGVRFMVVLIPTKERVFFDTFGGDTDGALRPVTELAHEEQEMLTELKNELGVSGISYIDVLPALRESLSGGESPYPIGSDGHPNARGHKAIAAAVWQAMTDSYNQSTSRWRSDSMMYSAGN
jgi:hypothetical protein